MQIDGNGTSIRINSYSKGNMAGEKPRKSDSDGAVPVDHDSGGTEGKKSPPVETGSKEASNKKEDPQKDPQIQQQIQELIQIQNKVIAHEQAHMSAGGELAGGASYSYTTGPDGKRYITGGEVSISTPAVKEPEEKIRVMAKVQAAALAPAQPSPQDMRVAASASAKEAEARIELSRKRAEAAYGSATGKTAESPKSRRKADPGSMLDISL